MQTFQKQFPAVSPEEILQMVTVNPARALQQQDALGQLRVGLRADLLAIACGKLATAYDEVVAFDGPVEWILVDGCVSEHVA
jgi:imidazolonepropionase-like amidohydrolase